MKFYSEKLELEPEAFVEMLVLDGCFIIELLVKLTLLMKNEQIFNENWKLPLIRSDILLLENQIPFFIIQALFDSTIIPEFVFEDKKANEPPVILIELALSYVKHTRMEFREGAVEIPQLSIQATTISEFRNLIAFKQCCPSSGSHFTSYATFMDNLINTEMDMAVLHDCSIIESKLGSYKDVDRFFNQLCKGGYMDYENHYLAKVFKDVRKYYDLNGIDGEQC
ncbi:hypothetical protein J5N97_017833 [Dioscorea zingiberensis]|uniref:Uncharacterized protein n=1 Tax=Dioscorea zingiberensis TaxID=325984 RepID=A0A9D5CLU3_9LILI|nr:hypothetical protein J5N97_017833 [Dioscorea zingiberensis]